MLFESLKKIISYLNPSDRKKLIYVFILNLLTTIVDTIGILSIFPFLQVVMRPELIQENKWLRLAYNGMHFETARTFLIVLGVVLIVLFVIANALKGFSLWWSTQFSYNCNRVVSTKLMNIYFNDSYLENIKKNSAQVASHLLTNVDMGISTILNAWISLTSSGLLVLLLLGILFVTQPGPALAIFVCIGIFYYFLESSIKYQLGELGQQSVKNSTNLYKNINEATGGVKEIKYLGREGKFLNDYNKTYKEYVELKSKSNLYQFMPKLVVDCLAFGIGIVVVIFVLGVGGNFSQSIPWMGLFAFIVLRLVPNAQVVLQQISRLRFSGKALALIDQDFEKLATFKSNSKENISPIEFNKSFEFKDISFAYTDGGRDILSDISFSMTKGEMVAFVGQTGAGKTTLIDVLLGLIKPYKGDIIIDGQFLNQNEIYRWQKNIGYVPQFVFLADDSVANNVAFGIEKDKIDLQRVIDACKKANIHEFIMEKLPLKYDSVIGERGIQLSGGQRQRLGIARALYHDPEVIILDEATSALDSQTEIGVMNEINSIAGIKTIIIIAHRLSTVKKCNQIYMLEHGRLTSSGNFEEMIKKEPEFFSKIY